MDVVRYTGQRPNRYPQVALSFGPNALISSALPNSGGDAGDFLEVKLDTFANTPQLRQFTVTTVDIFSRAQKQLKMSSTEPIPQPLVTEISVAYRGAILDLVESFQKTEESEDVAMLYSQLDCVWHFCEIMLISSHPEFPILPYYMDWIKANCDDSDANLMKIISELPELDAESLDLLWDVILKHTIHGKTKDAAKLLEFTNQTQSAVFGEQLSLMAELMGRKPEFQPNRTSMSEFNVAWQSWKDDCENGLESLIFAGSDQLTLIAKILGGREDGFLEAKCKIGTWYEYLCMVLNYQHPLLRPSSLRAFAAKAIDDFGDFSILLTPLDNILLAAMDYDIVTVLKEMQIHWNHPWFSLHFADLIYSGGVYSSIADARIDYEAVGPLRHELVREYGIQMMQHPALWEIGVTYLGSIPRAMGRPIIAELLQKIKPGSEMEAEKILRIAKKFDLHFENQGICRQMSLLKIQQGQLQNGLLWAVRAQDPQLTGTLVDRILEEGKDEVIPVLLELIPKFTTCGERLLFLNGFSEFTKLVKSGRNKEGITVLCNLITENIIPKRVRGKMLSTFRDVMMKGDVKLDPTEVSILMEFLHTEVEMDSIRKGLFNQLNQILLACRATEMLSQFQMSKKITRAGPQKV